LLATNNPRPLIPNLIQRYFALSYLESTRNEAKDKEGDDKKIKKAQEDYFNYVDYVRTNNQ
jgi:hypothetical protein